VGPDHTIGSGEVIDVLWVTGATPAHTFGSPIGCFARETSRGGMGRFARATRGQPCGRRWVRGLGGQLPGHTDRTL